MIHAMPDLRASRRAATEQSIIDAVHRVLADEHPTALSMPQVAAAAGVSLRTLYRYFPTKADLVDAASRSYEIEVNVEIEPPTDVDSLGQYLETMWRRFDADLPAVLAQHTTPAGRELRQRRLPRSRTHLRHVLRSGAPHLDDAAIDRLADTTVWMTSSASYLELTQHLGYGSADAARLVTSAVRAVVDDAIGGS
jgi:AcrR family transcriptional regulator